MEEAAGVDRPIDVIIADDHTVVRDGIRAVLEREEDEFRVVAEAADVPSTVREVREHKPDLLTLDLTMPGGSSLAALPSCFIAHPTLAVAILTMREDPEYARQALRAGARSYVLKEAEPAELLQAFRLAVSGGNYLHPRLGALMATGEEARSDGVVLLRARARGRAADRQRLHQPPDRRAAARRRAHRQDLPRPRDREARASPRAPRSPRTCGASASPSSRRAVRQRGERVQQRALACGRRPAASGEGRPASGTTRRTVVPLRRRRAELELAADELGALAHAAHAEAALQAVAARTEARRRSGRPLPSSVTDALTHAIALGDADHRAAWLRRGG